MEPKFVPILPCPEGCEISYDATVTPRLRLWTKVNGATRWVGAMYQDGFWFVNSIDVKEYVAKAEGSSKTQTDAWEKMLKTARDIGWDI